MYYKAYSPEDKHGFLIKAINIDVAARKFRTHIRYMTNSECTYVEIKDEKLL